MVEEPEEKDKKNEETRKSKKVKRLQTRKAIKICFTIHTRVNGTRTKSPRNNLEPKTSQLPHDAKPEAPHWALRIRRKGCDGSKKKLLYNLT